MARQLIPVLGILVSCCSITTTNAQQKSYEVIAYHTGNAATLRQYPLQKITQVIYSFLHLNGDTISFSGAAQQKQLLEITAVKNEYPHLKVLVSLGGWGGCATCSPVFSGDVGRKHFAASVVRVLKEYNADGLDLDWEYPAIEGYPGHPFAPEDKNNFTALLRELRKQMGDRYQLSFAAGGFQKYLEYSIDWPAVIPLVDRVNLMTYDLVGGYSTVTGHHTPLYSTPEQQESTDHCVQWLLQHNVPGDKLVIGAAFYGRSWHKVSNINNGLYQQGVFQSFINRKTFATRLSPDSGYQYFWDATAQAPYIYNAAKKEFATYDDARSIAAKVEYLKKAGLKGIMFWELPSENFENSLLDVIDQHIRN